MSSGEDDEYETWVTHDDIGVPHVIRVRKGARPCSAKRMPHPCLLARFERAWKRFSRLCAAVRHRQWRCHRR